MNRIRLAVISLIIFFTFTNVISAYDVVATNEILIVNGKITKDGYNADDDVKSILPITNEYNKFTDYLHGYSVYYPNNMYVDVHRSPVQTVLFDETTQIEIYYDNLNNSLANAWNYIYYSNGFIRNTTDHIKEYEKTFKSNGYSVHMLKWNRRKLKHIQNDKNYYLCSEIIKNSKEVYTVFFKSTMPLDDTKCMDIIKSFKFLEKKGKVNLNLLPTYEYTRVWNEETKTFFDDYFINSEQLTWGIFDNLAPDYLEVFKETEKKLDFKFDFLLRYHNLTSQESIENIQSSLEKAYADGRYVELTLQTSRDNAEEGNIVYDILDGEYDDYFKDYAKMLKDFSHPVMFRLNNEMNGDWCLYSSYHTSKDTEIYKALYKYLFTLFEEKGVDNVVWVWNPHDKSFPDFQWNHWMLYYPGDSFVDIVGLTGYNTGTYYPGEIWRGFNEIYDPLYAQNMNLFKKPFMLTEFSSSSIGGQKESWIIEMFDNILKYENIKAAIWWNGCDYDNQGNASRIYRLDENSDMIELFEERLQKFK